MTEIKAPTCCGENVKLDKDNSGQFIFKCNKCNRTGRGEDPPKAADNFNNQKENSDTKSENKSQPESNLNATGTQPKGKNELIPWVKENYSVISANAARFLDKKATKRMIDKNMEYVFNLKFDKAWNNEEGQKSIVAAFKESLWHGATMPEMGCIVPYGAIVEFIPAIEAFDFALTNGKNAPFKWIAIEGIYENDKYEQYRKDGNFVLNFTSIIADRGDIISVTAYGYENKRKKVVGEVYTKKRLMEKAKEHSQAYRTYLDDIKLFNHAKSEGTIKKENVKEYCIKKMYKKGGGTWDKKIFIDDIKNPYEGPDQPEMLRKSAGKTFFKPYMKTRNAVEMADEWTEDELEEGARFDKMDIVETSLNNAKNQFEDKGDKNIQEAKIILDETEENGDDEFIKV